MRLAETRPSVKPFPRIAPSRTACGARMVRALSEKPVTQTLSEHGKVFAEAFFKKLQKTPLFRKKATLENFYCFLSMV
ncbi:hypothetical protein LV564_15015 [Komagataeibacter nataicola]|uniref:hypothetical protein n=1 Tax=Komagataeibacter nataicola TaxID=265960 RepID=UPI001428C5B0|nr:hypothetical protein [Komagataeibacter nataicola]WEQ55376.1 hypothetical protein LV564_15015 [Komagataeibacter nataicola]WNM09755.1 hypothetical protein RI056_07650 [Komagataeibacter nataicola]